MPKKTFGPQQIVIRADRMEQGLDLNSPRNIPLGGFSGGKSARYEPNSAIYTGPGYRLAFDTGTGAPNDALHEGIIFPALWAVSGGKMFVSPDRINVYDIGISLSPGERTVLVEAGNGDMLFFNQIDVPGRIAISSLPSPVISTDTEITLNNTYSTASIKFGASGNVNINGNVISYSAITSAKNFTVDYTTFPGATYTCSNHGLKAGDSVTVTNSGGALPSGLSLNTNYYVIVGPTSDTFRLGAYKGSSTDVVLTDNGSPTNTFHVVTGKLYGVTGIPVGGLAAGSLVTQVTYPSTMAGINGNCAINFDGRIWVGNLKDKGNLVEWSAGDYDKTDPSHFYDFQGSPASFSLNIPRSTIAFAKGPNRLYYFTTRGVYYSGGLDVSLGSIPITNPLSEKYGAYNASCVVDMDGIVAFLGNRRLMPIMISTMMTPGTSMATMPTLDQDFDFPIRPWLQSLDDDDQQTMASLHYDHVRKILKITGIRNGVQETYIYDNRIHKFAPADVRPMSRYSMCVGHSYCGSKSNGKIYEDDIGLTNDGIPIIHSWTTGRIEYDKGRKLMQLLKIDYDGFMSKGCEHTLNIYLNGSPSVSFSRNYTDSLITSTIGYPLGGGLIGGSVIGGTLSPGLVYVYKNTILLAGLSCEDFRIEWITSKEGMYFQTNQFAVKANVLRLNLRTYS